MQDILLDSERDIAIVSGDFVVSVSDRQHQELLLLTGAGEWKEQPTRGVGVTNYVEREDAGQLARRIQTEFTSDGMRVERIDTNRDKIDVTANYEA